VTHPGQFDRWDVFLNVFPPGHTWDRSLVLGPVIRDTGRAVMMSRAHPLADREVIDIEDLADHDIVVPPVEILEGQSAAAATIHQAWVPRRTPGGRPLRLVPGLRLALFD
jgi:hypothetical protein